MIWEIQDLTLKMKSSTKVPFIKTIVLSGNVDGKKLCVSQNL